MSKRLQVLLDPAEYKTFANVAKAVGLSLGEWVRQSLRRSASELSFRSPETKIARLREIAQKNHFPISDIDQLLKEIEKGYSE